MKRLELNFKKALSLMISFLVVLSGISPSFSMTALGAEADSQSSGAVGEKFINEFKASLTNGATLQDDGKYVWTATNSSSGHRFIYRIEYSFSGESYFEPGEIVITIPKHILKNRDGNFADICELSIPEESQAIDTTEYVYIESGDDYIIKNHIERPAAENGYIEIAYDTSEKTFEYRDMAPSNPFQSSLVITKDNKDAQTDQIPVYINTNAKISSTSKSVSELYRSWETSWGTAPADANNYYYLVWTIRTVLLDVTQPYNFSINDVFNETDAEIVGYKMSGSSTFSSDANTVTNIKSDSYRYDYVLTRHLKSTYDEFEKYTLDNKETVTVTPVDGNDYSSSATASATFNYRKPTLSVPIGSFNSFKYGNDNWIYAHSYRWDIANYGLNDLQDGTVDNLDEDLKYELYSNGYAYPWTIEKGKTSTDIDSYGKRKVKYVVTDDTFYFNDDVKITNGSFVHDDVSPQLMYKDYEIISIDYDLYLNDAKFDNYNLKFVSTAPTINDDDILYFEAKFGEGDFVSVGSYNAKTDEVKFNSDYVKSMTSSNIVFAENCTGYRITAENAHYYTKIYSVPHCRIKNSEYIKSEIEGKTKVYLTNISNTTVNDSDGDVIFTKDSLARDYIIGIEKSSEIKKEITSISNNKVRRYLTIGWKVTMSETYMTNSGKQYVSQDSGTYYDLLPQGSEFDSSTVSVRTEKGVLGSADYDVSTVFNYKGSGRTLLVVNMKEQADYYTLTYLTTYPWESIYDYGSTVLNSVAYETGNAKISGGYPDNGGEITDKALISNLDPNTSSNKFLYAQKKYIIDIPTASTSGLTKKVKASGDSDYSLSTTVQPSEDYSYKIRYSTTTSTRAKNIVFFDSLENYKPNGVFGDWHGTLQTIDVSQPIKMGIAPVVYYSKMENLVIEEHRDLGEIIDGEKVWLTEAEIGYLSQAKAFAVDLSKTPGGDTFILDLEKSLSVILYMKAPESDETEASDPITYNNIYSSNVVMSIYGDEFESLIHHEYTTVRYRVMADFGIYKADSDDPDTPVKSISFCLEGTSDYGTGISKVMTTDKYGHITFKNIEKGTYKLCKYVV